MNGLACPPCRIDLLADDAVFVLGRVEGHDLTLQRQLVLVDNRCIDIGTWRDGESCLGHLIGYAEVVALGNVALRGEADGEGLLQADIVCCLVLGVILFISYIS